MSDSSQQSSFLRVLGRRDVVALAFGAMIGWSWVVLTGTWITSAGVLGAITAFLLGGGAIAVVGLTYAELSSAPPTQGASMSTAKEPSAIGLRLFAPGQSSWAICLLSLLKRLLCRRSWTRWYPGWT